MRLKITWLFLLALMINFANGQDVSIEPPFWWTDMANPNLQLLCKGVGLKGAKVSISDKNVELVGTQNLDSENYLALDLLVNKNATEGEIKIVFKLANGEKIKTKYSLLKRDKGSAERKGFDNSDVLYLITPDRFANGDTSNDEISTLREGLNREAEYGRHGGDLKGIENHLDYIKETGFTAIWLNPVLENDQDKWSYHGYATTDYYAVDPRFGTNEYYRDLSKKAKAKGIGMIMDIIVNHCGSFHPWMDDPPTKDWFNYQDAPYQQTNHRKETLLDPYASKQDRTIMTNGWFVPAMPDLNQRNKILSTYLIQNSIWWIEYADLYGIRQDTYSYPFREFMTDWTCAIMNEYPNFNIVGEEWIDSPAVISYWQRDKVNTDGYTSCLPSLMDFPLCFATHKALTEEEGWNEGLIKLYQSLSNDFQYAHPNDLVIFPDNHDMSRIYTQLDEQYNLYKATLIFMATTRGIPQLYYGTEILMSHPGTDSHGMIRSDFPGGWKMDESSVLENRNLSSSQKEALQFVKTLLNWRKEKKVIHNGKLIHYVPEDGTYVYFRLDGKEKIMVILNKNENPYALDLSRFAEQLNGVTEAQSILEKETYMLSDTLNLSPKTSYILELK